MRQFKLFLTLLTLMCFGVGQMWAGEVADKITASDLTATSSTYTDFSNVSATSDAKYAGNSAKTSSGGIQMRSKNSNSGIVSTTSGGIVKSVKITVESGSNTIDVYGSNTAYTAASDLYGNNKGTKIGSVTATGTVTFTDSYAYVGVRSNSGAIYLSEVEVTWTTTGGGDTPETCNDKVTLSKGSATFDIDKSTGVALECCSEMVVTVSNITIPAGKKILAITQNGINSGVTIDQDAKTVTYAANSSGTSTIDVTFEDLPTYTVTLKDDNSTLTQTSGGANVELPSREGCTGYTFAGWTKTWTSAQQSWTETAPTIIPAGNYIPEDNENLYPVYTKTESGDPISVTGGNMSSGVTTGWTTSGTGTYSGNGVKFDGANDYIQSPDLANNNYKALTVKLKAGYNGSTGSVLTIASLNASGTVIDSEDFTPNEAYTSQSTVNSFDLSGSDVIKYVRITMKSKTSNLGMAYCEVFADGSTTSYISVPDCKCSDPTIGTQPATSASYAKGASSVTALTVVASGTGTLTYQWYSNDENSIEGGEALDGATSASYTPLVTTVGTFYYYCVVGVQGETCSTTSNVATINVTQAITGITLNKNNTTLEVGEKETLTATIAPNDATEVAEWVSSDESIATVNQEGLVTAVAIGSATITCKSPTDNTIKGECAVTVKAHEITPGKYDDILLANALWGTSYTSGTTTTTANALDLRGTIHDIQIELTNGSSTSMYITDEGIRVYKNYTLTFTAPSGYNITKISFAKNQSKWDISAMEGLNQNADEWTGKANSVSFGFGGRTDMTTVSVTYAAETRYAVSFSAPSGGTLAIKNGDNPITTGDKFVENTVLDVTVTPTEATHHGGSVKVVKTGVDPEEDVTSTVYNFSTNKLTVPDYAITVSASFVADAAITVAVAEDQNEWGSVKLYNSTPAEVNSGTTFKPEASFKIEATPSDPDVYEFVSWAISEGSDITLSETDAKDNDPTLTAGEVSTTFTATFREKAQPYLEATKSALNFTTTAVGNNSQLTFDLSGENLTANATYSITGDDMFAVVSPEFPIAPAEGKITATTVTVKYAPTEASESHSATLTITSGAASVEITLSGSAETAYTAKWYVNGSEVTESTVTEVAGTALTFPANPTPSGDCKNLTFVGWLTGELDEESENAPQGLITDATGHTMPAADINYYAVFAEKEGEDIAAGYSLSNAAPAAGDQVIIARLVSETYYGLTTASNPSTVALTVSDGLVSEPANVIWNVEDATSGVYLRPIGELTGLHMNSSALKVANGNDNGDIIFSANQNGSFKGTRADDARWIVTNSTTGLSCSATEANAAELYIFKYSAGSQATYSNYVTSCVLCNKVTLAKAGETNGTITLKQGENEVSSVKTCNGDVTLTTNAEAATGYALTNIALSGTAAAKASVNEAMTEITIQSEAAGALTVTATFSQINYNVSMEQTGDANATISGNQENKHYGEEITVTAEAVEGYGFTGWTFNTEVTFVENYDATMATTKFNMPNANVTATANYALITNCAISFKVNGATVATEEVTQAQEYIIPNNINHPTVSGFTFLGWSETEYAEETDVLPTIITSFTPAAQENTKTLYGIYKREQIEDHGHYVLNYTADVASKTLGYGKAVDVTATDGSEWVVKAYKSNGMQINTGKDASIKIPTCPGKIFSIAITCEQAKAVGLSASDYSGSGSITYIKYGTDATSQTLDLSEETVTAGYIVPKNGSTAITNIDVEFDASKTWYTSSPAVKVTITFKANGGEGGCQKAIINQGTQLTICETAPTLTHMDFTGWNTVAEGGGTAYAAGQTYTFNADVTLYAQWTDAATYAVTYNVNGSDAAAPTQAAQFAGDQFDVADAIARNGYTFQGWKYGNTLFKAGDSFTMPNKAVEFVAQWRKASIPVDKMSMITDASALTNGMQVALGCSYVKNDVSYFAMAGEFPSGKTYMSSESENITLNDGVATYTNAVVIMTLEQVEGGWKITKDGTNYLTSTGEDIKWDTQANATVWAISFNGNNVAITNGDNKMQYNSNNNSLRFKTYTSTLTAIQLFGKAVVVTEDVNISDLGYVEGEAVVASGENVTLTINVPTTSQSISAQNGATVSIEAETSAESLAVEEGSKIVVNAPTTTPTVYFSTTMGSTQTPGAGSELSNVTNITLPAGGEIIYDLTLGTSLAGVQADPNQWHAFTVPFQVDALNGVYDAETGEKLTNEVNYAIMDYHGEVRANGGYGWKKFRGTMTPGTFYLMTVDGNTKTFRFKAAQTGTITQTTSMSVTAFNGTSENNNDKGWNGIGNPAWVSGTVAKAVYVLDPYSYEYVLRNASAFNFSVSTPFFYFDNAKTDATSEIEMAAANAGAYYAPSRMQDNEIKNVEISFGNEVYRDLFYISASEDALNEFEQDEDQYKLRMSNTPKVAQIMGNAYGQKMAKVYAPLENNQAIYDLDLYAPAAGTYSLSSQAIEGATLYVTYNGAIVWNLSLGEYEIDLARGTTTGYGLLLVAQPNQMPTGVDTTEGVGGDAVQKILLNGQLYILRDGHLFDAVGKEVK